MMSLTKDQTLEEYIKKFDWTNRPEEDAVRELVAQAELKGAEQREREIRNKHRLYFGEKNSERFFEWRDEQLRLESLSQKETQ